MMGSGSGRLLPAARSVDVPLTADSVAPSRLVSGSLDLAPDASRDDGYAAIYFTVAGDGQLRRVTFEGIDARRAARGEGRRRGRPGRPAPLGHQPATDTGRLGIHGR